MDPVVHFEIPVDDVERAKKFYGLFGWQMDDMPGMDYVGITTTPAGENHIPKKPGAINGGMMKRSAEAPAPLVAIQVDSVDTYLEKISAAGGQIMMPKTKIGEMGYYAYVKDTEGNVIGIWETIE